MIQNCFGEAYCSNVSPNKFWSWLNHYICSSKFNFSKTLPPFFSKTTFFYSFLLFLFWKFPAPVVGVYKTFVSNRFQNICILSVKKVLKYLKHSSVNWKNKMAENFDLSDHGIYFLFYKLLKTNYNNFWKKSVLFHFQNEKTFFFFLLGNNLKFWWYWRYNLIKTYWDI